MALSLRVNTFLNKQNLFHSPKSAFPNASGDNNPNVLATLVAKRQSWHLFQTQFFSAIPDQNRYQISEKFRNLQWFRIKHDECKTTARMSLCDGSDCGREIGIGIRIARHLRRSPRNQQMDVARVFLNDQDFAEVVPNLRVFRKKLAFL